tara:strand:- start:1502 stop:2521 length:1020 start_codon:yes stop_codon:yes gene_type:complete
MHGLVTGQDPRQRRGDLELKLENPLGFFESERLVEINDGLLQTLGCQWDRPPLLPASWDQPPLLDALQLPRSRLATYALEQAWVDKDPRLCITYPAYLHILLRRIPLVVALRDPLAVATSLHARNGFSLNRGLVLWWIYNHHIASHLCSKDLLVPYRSLLTLDDQALQRLVGPFLEHNKHQRPSVDQARALITSLLKPEFNRAEDALNTEIHARIHPLLLDICELAYKNTIHSGDQLAGFQEHFNSVPRAVLECSVRDQLLPEADITILQKRLQLLESDIHNVRFSLDQRERDCAVLQQQVESSQRALHLAERQLIDLRNSRSWKLTRPLRALFATFRK